MVYTLNCRHVQGKKTFPISRARTVQVQNVIKKIRALREEVFNFLLVHVLQAFSVASTQNTPARHRCGSVQGRHVYLDGRNSNQ